MIGTAPLEVVAPDLPGQVVYKSFDIPSALPLPGATSLSDYLTELEADKETATHLREARKELASFVDATFTLRRLRLEAGLSQAKLAQRADTTQTYVARVEAGTLDPGTDMLVRLAAALECDAAQAFSAVMNQRIQKKNPRGS